MSELEKIASLLDKIALLRSAMVDQWMSLAPHKPSPARLFYHAFEAGMHAGFQGANHKRDCPYDHNDYRMWWMHGCIVGENRRDARNRIAELEAAMVVQARPQQAGQGKDLPDAPGPWFRNGETWINWNFVNSDDGKLFALDRLSDNGHFTKRVLTADAPRGNWHQARPDEKREEIAALKQQLDEAERERDDARLRLLSAAGDDLCRLTPEEIKELSSGSVKIPPKEEFIASCERFHQQLAAGPGVLNNCLMLAQLIAENEKLRRQIESSRSQAMELVEKWWDKTPTPWFCADELEALVK